MADPVNQPNQPAVDAAQPAVDAAQPVNSLAGKTIDQVSASEAKLLLEEAKATGKTPEEVLASKQGQPKSQPVQSTKEALKDAAQEAKRRLKIDNEEIDEDEVIKIYRQRKQHQQAASRELNEGKAARKQAEDFIAMMRDPQKFYETAKKLGHDPRKLAEQYLVNQLQDEMMDPRDKELRDAKAKLKEIEDLERKQKEAVERQRLEQMKAKFAEDYNKQFIAALEESGLPPTKPMVAEMAKYISRSAKIGFKMTAQEAAQLVKEDLQNAHRRLIGDTDGETLIKLLGEDVANKVRKYDTSKLKDPNQHLKTPSKYDQPEPRTDRGAPSKRMSAKEWREYNRSKKR